MKRLKFVGGKVEGPIASLPLIQSFYDRFTIGEEYRLDRDLHQTMEFGPEIVVDVKNNGIPARKSWFEEVEEDKS